jgi:dihydroorotate dehydrogenase (fumarate)
VAIKLAPYFSSMSHLAAELVQAGAAGLVLFNRYYAPDIDLATLRVTRSLPLSTAAELPLSLVWIALLSRRVACSLAASRGVETAVEVIKYLLVGADVVTTASALLRRGPAHISTMREGLERWLKCRTCSGRPAATTSPSPTVAGSTRHRSPAGF